MASNINALPNNRRALKVEVIVFLLHSSIYFLHSLLIYGSWCLIPAVIVWEALYPWTGLKSITRPHKDKQPFPAIVLPNYPKMHVLVSKRKLEYLEKSHISVKSCKRHHCNIMPLSIAFTWPKAKKINLTSDASPFLCFHTAGVAVDQWLVQLSSNKCRKFNSGSKQLCVKVFLGKTLNASLFLMCPMGVYMWSKAMIIVYIIIYSD